MRHRQFPPLPGRRSGRTPQKRGVSSAHIRAATRGLEPDLEIMELAATAQPEFEKSIWDYLDDLVNDERIATGRDCGRAKPRGVRRG